MNLELLLLPLAVGLSAFGSGSEIAFSGASRVRAHGRAMFRGGLSRMADRLLSKPTLYLSTTLIATNVGNVVASTIAARWARAMNTGWAEPVTVALTALVILLAGEIVPKRLFFEARDRIVDKLAPVLLAIRVILYPVILVAERLSGLISGGGGSSATRLFESREEVRSFLESSGHTHGKVAGRILDLAAGSVEQYMKPAVVFSSVKTDDSPEKAVAEALRSRRGFVLVYEQDGKSLLGYARTREMVRREEGWSVEQVTESLPYFDRNTVPSRAVYEMRRDGSPVGVVLDRRGQPAGLISVEEVVDVLLGSSVEESPEPKGSLHWGENGSIVL